MIKGTRPAGMLVGSAEAPSSHPRTQEALARIERTSSVQAIDRASQLSLIVSQIVPMTADECEAVAQALHAPLKHWAAESRRALIAQLDRAEHELDRADGSAAERWRSRWASIRRRLAPLAQRHPEVRRALAEDR